MLMFLHTYKLIGQGTAMRNLHTPRKVTLTIFINWAFHEMSNRIFPSKVVIMLADLFCCYYLCSTAPYENVRLLHDVGMAHYSKSGFRWEVSYKKLYTWRSAKTKVKIKFSYSKFGPQAIDSTCKFGSKVHKSCFGPLLVNITLLV